MMDKLRYFVHQLDGDERIAFSYILDAAVEAEAKRDNDTAADLLQAMKILARFSADRKYNITYVKIYDEAHEIIMGVSA